MDASAKPSAGFVVESAMTVMTAMNARNFETLKPIQLSRAPAGRYASTIYLPMNAPLKNNKEYQYLTFFVVIVLPFQLAKCAQPQIAVGAY